METTIGKRLSDFAKQKYGTIKALAEAIDVRPQALNTYIHDKSKPGNALQQKLRAAWCDIEWLMTGQKKDETGSVVKKLSNEQEVYIRVLESEVKYLREKVATYEEYLNFAKKKES